MNDSERVSFGEGCAFPNGANRRVNSRYPFSRFWRSHDSSTSLVKGSVANTSRERADRTKTRLDSCKLSNTSRKARNPGEGWPKTFGAIFPKPSHSNSCSNFAHTGAGWRLGGIHTSVHDPSHCRY